MLAEDDVPLAAAEVLLTNEGDILLITGRSEDSAWLNEYIFAIENTLSTNDGIYTICQEGGGGVGHLVYGNSRQGINQSLDRLIPAIETANELLGG